MARDLIAAIKEKQNLIEKLQTELDEAKALLLNGKGRRPAPEQDRVRLTKRRSSRRGKQTAALPYKPHSSVGKAVKALKDAGEPLHIDALISRIRGKVKKNTLVGNLSRYVNEGVVFSRTAPATFGLLEWKEKSSGEESKEAA